MRRVLAIAASLVVLVACSDDVETRQPDPEPAPSETSATPGPVETEAEVEEEGSVGRVIPLQLWFLSELRGEPVLKLHHVEIPATTAIGRTALEQLLAGVPGDLEARDPKAWSAIPEGTELLGLTIDNGTATVDFNSEFGNTGLGSSYDGIQIDQVTWTLTQFPTVKRVGYLIDGEVPAEGIGGHGIVLDKPQTRKNNEHYLPPIVVEHPIAGETIDRVFDVSGISNVFEATVSWRLVDRGGKTVQEGFTTASCGTGCWGDFFEKITLGSDALQEDHLTLQVFESSAEDGSPLHMVRVPVDVGS